MERYGADNATSDLISMKSSSRERDNGSADGNVVITAMASAEGTKNSHYSKEDSQSEIVDVPDTAEGGKSAQAFNAETQEGLSNLSPPVASFLNRDGDGGISDLLSVTQEAPALVDIEPKAVGTSAFTMKAVSGQSQQDAEGSTFTVRTIVSGTIHQNYEKVSASSARSDFSTRDTAEKPAVPAKVSGWTSDVVLPTPTTPTSNSDDDVDIDVTSLAGNTNATSNGDAGGKSRVVSQTCATPAMTETTSNNSSIPRPRVALTHGAIDAETVASATSGGDLPWSVSTSLDSGGEGVVNLSGGTAVTPRTSAEVTTEQVHGPKQLAGYTSGTEVPATAAKERKEEEREGEDEVEEEEEGEREAEKDEDDEDEDDEMPLFTPAVPLSPRRSASMTTPLAHLEKHEPDTSCHSLTQVIAEEVTQKPDEGHHDADDSVAGTVRADAESSVCSPHTISFDGHAERKLTLALDEKSASEGTGCLLMDEEQQGKMTFGIDDERPEPYRRSSAAFMDAQQLVHGALSRSLAVISTIAAAIANDRGRGGRGNHPYGMRSVANSGNSSPAPSLREEHGDEECRSGPAWDSPTKETTDSTKPVLPAFGYVNREHRAYSQPATDAAFESGRSTDDTHFGGRVIAANACIEKNMDDHDCPSRLGQSRLRSETAPGNASTAGTGGYEESRSSTTDEHVSKADENLSGLVRFETAPETVPAPSRVVDFVVADYLKEIVSEALSPIDASPEQDVAVEEYNAVTPGLVSMTGQTSLMSSNLRKIDTTAESCSKATATLTTPSAVTGIAEDNRAADEAVADIQRGKTKAVADEKGPIDAVHSDTAFDSHLPDFQTDFHTRAVEATSGVLVADDLSMPGAIASQSQYQRMQYAAEIEREPGHALDSHTERDREGARVIDAVVTEYMLTTSTVLAASFAAVETAKSQSERQSVSQAGDVTVEIIRPATKQTSTVPPLRPTNAEVDVETTATIIPAAGGSGGIVNVSESSTAGGRGDEEGVSVARTHAVKDTVSHQPSGTCPQMEGPQGRHHTGRNGATLGHSVHDDEDGREGVSKPGNEPIPPGIVEVGTADTKYLGQEATADNGRRFMARENNVGDLEQPDEAISTPSSVPAARGKDCGIFLEEVDPRPLNDSNTDGDKRVQAIIPTPLSTSNASNTNVYADRDVIDSKTLEQDATAVEEQQSTSPSPADGVLSRLQEVQSTPEHLHGSDNTAMARAGAVTSLQEAEARDQSMMTARADALKWLRETANEARSRQESAAVPLSSRTVRTQESGAEKIPSSENLNSSTKARTDFAWSWLEDKGAQAKYRQAVVERARFDAMGWLIKKGLVELDREVAREIAADRARVVRSEARETSPETRVKGGTPRRVLGECVVTAADTKGARTTREMGTGARVTASVGPADEVASATPHCLRSDNSLTASTPWLEPVKRDEGSAVELPTTTKGGENDETFSRIMDVGEEEWSRVSLSRTPPFDALNSPSLALRGASITGRSRSLPSSNAQGLIRKGSFSVAFKRGVDTNIAMSDTSSMELEGRSARSAEGGKEIADSVGTDHASLPSCTHRRVRDTGVGSSDWVEFFAPAHHMAPAGCAYSTETAHSTEASAATTTHESSTDRGSCSTSHSNRDVNSRVDERQRGGGQLYHLCKSSRVSDASLRSTSAESCQSLLGEAPRKMTGSSEDDHQHSADSGRLHRSSWSKTSNDASDRQEECSTSLSRRTQGRAGHTQWSEAAENSRRYVQQWKVFLSRAQRHFDGEVSFVRP